MEHQRLERSNSAPSQRQQLPPHTAVIPSQQQSEPRQEIGESRFRCDFTQTPVHTAVSGMAGTVKGVIQRQLDEDFQAKGKDEANEKSKCAAFAAQVSKYVDQAHEDLMSGNVTGWKGAKITTFLRLLFEKHPAALVHAGNAIEERVYALMEGTMPLKWTPQFSEQMGGASFPDIVINLDSGKEALIDITSARGHILGKSGAWTTSTQYIYVAEAYFPSVYREHLPIILNAVKAGGLKGEDLEKRMKEVEEARKAKVEEKLREDQEATDLFNSYGSFAAFVREAYTDEDGKRHPGEAAKWLRDHGLGGRKGVPKKAQRKSLSPEQRQKKREAAHKALMNKLSPEEIAERAKRKKERAAELKKMRKDKALLEERRRLTNSEAKEENEEQDDEIEMGEVEEDQEGQEDEFEMGNVDEEDQ